MKFKVSTTATEYYQETIIEAENKEQAEEKYLQMVEDAQIIATNYEYNQPKVERFLEKRNIDCLKGGE